jgi:hypothetical protein
MPAGVETRIRTNGSNPAHGASHTKGWSDLMRRGRLGRLRRALGPEGQAYRRVRPRRLVRHSFSEGGRLCGVGFSPYCKGQMQITPRRRFAASARYFVTDYR